MKRRNRILLMWMLTGIWLCVQSPFAHALRTQAHAHPPEHAIAADQAAEAPCHDAGHQPAPVDLADCCADGHCDGQCAQLSWAHAGAAPLIVRRAAWLAPLQLARMQDMRQPELFRPPI